MDNKALSLDEAGQTPAVYPQIGGVSPRSFWRRISAWIRSTLIRALPLWLLLVPLLFLLPALGAFPYPPESPYSDLALAHYTYASFIQHTLLQQHILPLWSPLILSGAPLAANPLYGLFYPPGWLALLFPLPFGFNLAIAMHLLWGGLGMYLLLRREELTYRPALLGALAFEALPKLFAHYGAGHLTLLFAVPWTPWLLYCAALPIKQYAPWKRLARSVLPAVILALIFTADPRWAGYAGVLWWGYAFARRSVFLPLPSSPAPLPTLPSTTSTPPPSTGLNLRLFWRLLGQTALAALLAAPLVLPLLEFTNLSTRSHLAASDIFAFSLPFAKVLGLLYPDFGGMHEWILYSGGVILILALLAVMWGSIRRLAAFWLWTALLSLLFSFGANLPFLPLLASLPGFSLLRVPSRALFLTGMAIAALAAYAVERLLSMPSPLQRRRAGLLLTALAGFGVALSAGVWFIAGSLPVNFAWGSAVLLVGAIWIGLRLAGKLPARAWYLGLLALCLLDWAAMDLSLYVTRSPQEVFAEGNAVAQYLAAQPGQFRLYSPSYSLPQQTAANAGLQLADGVDPLQLQSYVDFMSRSDGVPAAGYSVTLPPFGEADPSLANVGSRPDPALLGLLNVRFVAAEFDLPVNGLVLVQRFGETRLYQNMQALPRAWVQPQAAAPGAQIQAAQIDTIAWSPNRILLQVNLPAGGDPRMLVLSEILYPGWQARLDSRPVEILLVGGLLRGVPVTSGEHRVELVFRPFSLALGLGLWLAGVVIILFMIWQTAKLEDKPSQTPTVQVGEQDVAITRDGEAVS